MNDRIQSPQEELANAVTHGVAFLLSLALTPMLITKATVNDTVQITLASAVFSFGILMSYLSSTLYHAVQNLQTKKQLRIWDHISIFFLIGGTYTPIICKYTKPGTAAIFLSFMWGIILAGSVLKVFFTGRYDRLSTALYLMLGWMVVFVITPLRANMPLAVFTWILAGGLSYTFGVIFYKWHRLKFHHSIWHLFVFAGTGFHFVGVYKCLGGLTPPGTGM